MGLMDVGPRDLEGERCVHGGKGEGSVLGTGACGYVSIDVTPCTSDTSDFCPHRHCRPGWSLAVVLVLQAAGRPDTDLASGIWNMCVNNWNGTRIGPRKLTAP